MKHIPLRDQEPDAAWLMKANRLLDELKAAPNAAARDKIIDDNSAVWGELKQWLLHLSHQKCWFSEAKDCFSHWDVEHYRPKKSAKDADGTAHDGIGGSPSIGKTSGSVEMSGTVRKARSSRYVLDALGSAPTVMFGMKMHSCSIPPTRTIRSCSPSIWRVVLYRPHT
jgi:hypothetical protein